MNKLLELAESLDAKSKAACRVECAPEYHTYWRGYSTAFEEAAAILRARSEQETTLDTTSGEGGGRG